MKKKDKKIEQKIINRLSKGGYLFNFTVVNIFRENKFETFQGEYVADFQTDKLRKIDILAQKTTSLDGSFLRVVYIIKSVSEKDMPWVIFTDPGSQISFSACLAQTMATKSANAILWILANDKKLEKLSIFQTPKRPGFDGKQVFNEENDTIKIVLENIMSECYSKKKEYESEHQKPEDSLSFGVVIIPIVVVSGQLFEAFYNNEHSEVEVKEKTHIRLHWKGSEAWRFNSTIDIVTIEYLHEHVQKLSSDTKILLQKMSKLFPLIKDCVQKKTLSPLKHEIGSSKGILKAPPLLRYLEKNQKNK